VECVGLGECGVCVDRVGSGLVGLQGLGANVVWVIESL
jgi:hypothetical protein